MNEEKEEAIQRGQSLFFNETQLWLGFAAERTRCECNETKREKNPFNKIKLRCMCSTNYCTMYTGEISQ
jgi:hypothetical protein